MAELAVLRMLAWCSQPAFEAALFLRRVRGRETARSIGERRALAPVAPRPPSSWRGKPVIWCHGASLGESIAVLPLARALLEQCAERRVLITTGTLTARKWLGDVVCAGSVEGLPSARVATSLVPYDARATVERFLRTWRPSCAILVESEVWPALVCSTAAHGVPLALVNGRMSARSHARWRSAVAAPIARSLFGQLAVVSAQCAEQRTRFALLGAHAPAAATANLKWADPRLPRPSAEAVGALERALDLATVGIAPRARWLALSTHSGEDEMVADAHVSAARQGARSGVKLLTIVIPRHADSPERIAEAERAFAERGLTVVKHSTRARPSGTRDGSGGAMAATGASRPADVYLCDAIGEVGVFLQLVRAVLVCGSLVRGPGGHNVLEPMRAGCATLVGPHAHAIDATLDAAVAVAPGAVIRLRSTEELAPWLERLVVRAAAPDDAGSAAAELAGRGRAAFRAARALEDGALRTVVQALACALPMPRAEQASSQRGRCQP